MNDLEIKANVITDLRLPLKLIEGKLDTMDLQVPWSKIQSSPVVVRLKGLNIELELDENVDFTEDDMQLNQKAIIESLENRIKKSLDIEQRESEEDGSSGKSKTELGFTDKLSIQVLDNLQITLENINISVMHTENYLKRTINLGIKYFELVTTDENQNPIYLDRQTGMVKMEKLKEKANESDAEMPAFEKEIKMFKNGIITDLYIFFKEESTISEEL